MSATFSDLHARYELALGGACPVPKPKGGESFVNVTLQAAELEKLVAHWLELPPASRPRLRGLTKSRTNGDTFELLLDAGGKTPRLSQIWPYAAWWEEELRGFEGARIEQAHKEGGISWRQS